MERGVPCAAILRLLSNYCHQNQSTANGGKILKAIPGTIFGQCGDTPTYSYHGMNGAKMEQVVLRLRTHFPVSKVHTPDLSSVFYTFLGSELALL